MVNRVNLENTGKRNPWQFMNRFIIRMPDGSIYLDRLRIISTPYFGIMLHKFTGPDAEPYLHDHPWSFISIILRGGYSERFRNNMDRSISERHIRFFNFKRKDDAHYIYALDRNPSWSLVIHGRRLRTWGFYVPDEKNLSETFVEFESWEEWKSQNKQRF